MRSFFVNVFNLDLIAFFLKGGTFVRLHWVLWFLWIIFIDVWWFLVNLKWFLFLWDYQLQVTLFLFFLRLDIIGLDILHLHFDLLNSLVLYRFGSFVNLIVEVERMLGYLIGRWLFHMLTVYINGLPKLLVGIVYIKTLSLENIDQHVLFVFGQWDIGINFVRAKLISKLRNVFGKSFESIRPLFLLDHIPLE